MKKTALISILGAPNAGKSTLLNQIIGQKISIVTPKVQTTRSIIKGIYTKEEIQLIFLDTPGIFNPQKNLEKAMVRSAWSSISGADIICILIDLNDKKTFKNEFDKILKHISTLNIPKIIIFNKADTLKDKGKKFRQPFKAGALGNEELTELNIPEQQLEKLKDILAKFNDEDCMFISARDNINIDNLLARLADLAPKGEWLYAEDEITTAPMRFLSSEITREHLFLMLSDELPYNLTVETDLWQQVNENEVKIYQNIIVNREAHKKIILGENGKKIKEISTRSRKLISENLGFKAHLFLFVKVREDWDNKSIYYNNMGLSLIK